MATALSDGATSSVPHPSPASPVPSTTSSTTTVTQPPPVPSKPSGLQTAPRQTVEVRGSALNSLDKTTGRSPVVATFLGPALSGPIVNANATSGSSASTSPSIGTGTTGSSPRIRSSGMLNAGYAIAREGQKAKDEAESPIPGGRGYAPSPTPSSNGSFHTPAGSVSGSSPNVASASPLLSSAAGQSEPSSRASISRKGSAPPLIGITASSPPHSATSSAPSPTMYTPPFPSSFPSPTTGSSSAQPWGAPPPLPTRRPGGLGDHGRKSSISRGIQQIAGGLGFFGGSRSGSSMTLTGKGSVNGELGDGSTSTSRDSRRESSIGGNSRLKTGSGVSGTSTGGPSRWMPRRGSSSSTTSSIAKVEVGLGVSPIPVTRSGTTGGQQPPSLPPRQEQTETLLSPDQVINRSRSPSPRRDRLSSHTSLEDGMGLGVPPLPARAMATAPLTPRGKSEDLPRTVNFKQDGKTVGHGGLPPPPVASRKNLEQSSVPSYGSWSKTDKGRELLGSAVSTGWSAFTKAKSKGGQAISNLREQRAAGGLTSSLSSESYVQIASSSSSGGRPPGDGPYFAPGVMKRRANLPGAQVFGVDVGETAGAWGCECSDAEMQGWDRAKRTRMETLPAVAVRCVDYLMIWTPDEEGIFRISGRSSHIALLRKTFDTGGDVDLSSCDPGDIDPHAVASLYKSYLRELPSPILTADLAPEFDAFILDYTGVKAQEDDFGAKVASLQLRDADARVQGPRVAAEPSGKTPRDLLEHISDLMARLPPANRYLLSDLARLLAWTSSHASVNKMTLQNLLMVFCPSISLSPPFLKLLVEHHEEVFTGQIRQEEASTSPSDIDPAVSISTSTPSLSTEPSTSSSMGSAPKELPSSTVPLAQTDGQSAKASTKYSTPIADRFARTGPVTLSLREPTETAV